MAIPCNNEEMINKWINKRENREIRLKNWTEVLEKQKKEKDKSFSFEKVLYFNFKNGKGNNIPSPKDINQGGNIFSISGDTQFDSCPWLATLMGMARQNYKSIYKLIRPDPQNPHYAVNVYLHDFRYNWNIHYKPEKNVFDCVFTIEPTEIRKVKVDIDDILKIGRATQHRRLWPLVVEIAVAKEMHKFPDMGDPDVCFNSGSWKSYRDEVLKYYLSTTQDSDPEKSYKRDQILYDQDGKLYKEIRAELDKSKDKILEDLKQQMINKFNNSICTGACITILTGKKSRTRCSWGNIKYLTTDVELFIKDVVEHAGGRLISAKDICWSKDDLPKKFVSRDKIADRYNPREEATFRRIDKKLRQRQVVTASFKSELFKDDQKHEEDISIDEIAGRVLSWLENEVDEKLEKIVQACELSKDPKLSSLKEEDIRQKFYGQQFTKREKKSLVLSCIDNSEKMFGKNIENEKRKIGIFPGHAYVVKAAISIAAGDEVTTEDKPVYKFIVLENTHKMTTKVNYDKACDYYSKSAKQFIENNQGFKTVKKLYIDNNRTCIMELNHFCKLLSNLTYSRN